jgi:predicted CXXCH cytochrome family protein
MRRTPSPRIAFLFLLLAAAMPVWGVEHPGVLLKDADCSSCHAKKISGASVHSAMATSCTVCHVSKTQGDMTTINLAMPKEQICFACHEKSAELQQHVPLVKRPCVDCHDAHSSDQRMLLREVAGPPLSAHK